MHDMSMPSVQHARYDHTTTRDRSASLHRKVSRETTAAAFASALIGVRCCLRMLRTNND